MILQSAKLRKYREQFRYSQTLLAREMSVSQTTIWYWEQKDTSVKLEHLIRLAELFQIGVNELTQADIVQPPHSTTQPSNSGLHTYLASRIPTFGMIQELSSQLLAMESRLNQIEQHLMNGQGETMA